MTTERKCKECQEVMAAWEHPAAKSCLKCRDPEKYAAKMAELTPMGEVVGPSPEEAKEQQKQVVPPPDQAPAPVRPATPFFLKPGDQVSLNLKQRKFLILPDSGWELNPRKWTDTVPEGITGVELKQLRVCLEAGDLIKGEVYTGITKDPTTLNKAVKLLNFGEIERRKALAEIGLHTGLVGGYQPHEIYRYLIRYEDDNEHRMGVLKYLEICISNVSSGPPRSTPLVNKTIEQVTNVDFSKFR